MFYQLKSLIWSFVFGSIEMEVLIKIFVSQVYFFIWAVLGWDLKVYILYVKTFKNDKLS